MPSSSESILVLSQIGDSLPGRQRLWAASTLILGSAIATLDTSIANTALPTIAADLRTTPDASIWIINAYQIAMVATLLPFAALGDIVGHRYVYLYGLLVFTLASLACGLADSLTMLIAARMLQGVVLAVSDQYSTGRGRYGHGLAHAAAQCAAPCAAAFRWRRGDTAGRNLRAGRAGAG